MTMNGLRIGRAHSMPTVQLWGDKPIKSMCDELGIKLSPEATFSDFIEEVRKKRPDWHVISDKFGDFYRYFCPVVAELSNYYCVLREDPIYCFFGDIPDDIPGGDSRIDNDWLIEHNQNFCGEMFYMKKGYLSKFAKSLIFPDGEIFCFEKPLNSFKDFLKAYSAVAFTESNVFIDETVDIYFQDVDEAFWEIYSKREDLLQVVRTEIMKQEGYYVKDCNIMDRIF